MRRSKPSGATTWRPSGSDWQRRLRRQGVYVPDVRANVDGEFVTLVTDARAEHGFRVCVLFDWVAGRSLRTRTTERLSAALGRLAARLHQDAAAWSPAGADDVLVAVHAERVRTWMRRPDGL
jgi:Ser/Thr protein kinase RdoA (MazF antagonist)